MGPLRRRGVVALAALLALVVVGCSGGDDAGETSDDRGIATEGQTDAAGQDVAGGDIGGEDVAGGAAEGDAAPGAPAVAVGGDTAGRDVIREAALTLASDDPDATVDGIGRAAEQAGGFVAGTDLRREDGVLRGTVTVRVPADGLAGALGRIEAAGDELRSRELSSRDVTGEVADVAAQLRTLRAVEEQLLAVLAEARENGGTEDVLTVFDRMRDVRTEIERLEGRRARLADLVALATVTVRVVPSAELLAATQVQPDPAAAPWDPGRQLAGAWDATVDGMQAAVDVAIVLVVTVLPLVVLWGLPVALVVAVVRRWRRDGAPWSPRAAAAVPTPTTGPSVPSAPDRDRD